MSARSPLQKLQALGLLALLSFATSAFGIEPPHDHHVDKSSPMVEFSTPALAVTPSVVTIEPGTKQAFTHIGLQSFLSKHSSKWTIAWDTRSDLPHLIQGAGIPLIPGKGNSLSAEGLKTSTTALEVADIAGLLRGFMNKNADLLGADHELVLDLGRSVGFGPNKHFWSIEFQQHHQGIPVEGAHVFFRVNNGNIVQFGTNKVGRIDLDVNPAVSDRETFKIAFAQLGIDAKVIEGADRGALRIFPSQNRKELLGELYKGARGLGYKHHLAWVYTFRIEGSDHLYKLIVDAHTGEILEYLDLTHFADVQANVYPVTNSDPLVTVNLPFATVSNGGTKITDSGGNYTYSGGTATVQLNGRYTSINDNCGNISLSNSTDGNIDFGGAGGTDCTTPGFGGSGNTHSARTGFYHLTNINRTAAQFLPGNTWLNGTLTANMNINQNCNAFWNGSTVNFYTSGGGCANTGEIAAVFLHEWGHGMDQNAGGTVGENGTGEAIGDSFAFIELRDPCIGENFLSSPCFNCNSTCTGVRDVSAYAIGGVSTISRPDTVEDNAGMNCDRLLGLNNIDCPYTTPTGFAYRGPMGYEGHCESYIASSANWDLAQMLITELGTEGGWDKMEELWYSIMTPMGSAYQVVSGGQCNPNATVNGCGSSNWYTLYVAADDDDGDLSNGTPNACRIWDAFDAHGIACGSRPQCSTTCTPSPVADAGADQTINEGNSIQIGTAAQAGHTYSWSPGGATSAQINVSPTSTTTYTVTATTSCGSSQDSVTVTVIPAGSNGPQTAVYNSGLGAPLCSVAGSSCDSSGLLDSRSASLSPAEPNQPNTLDGCADGTAGSYHSDESNDRLVISTLDGGNFSEGDTVEVEATVYAWNTGSEDTLDLFYAADASNPSWTLITSLSPSGGGLQTLSAQYTLPSTGASQQAVRAQFRYQSTNAACAAGTYNDRDDLIFAVETVAQCSVDADCNDGLFCNGTETCNAGTCEAGTAPSCSDGVSCTDDSCNESTDSCDNTVNNANCDNGLFCDGTETCDAVNDCQSGTPVSCADGVSCTVDSCNEATDSCDNTPNDSACDNGLFCDGSETCDAVAGCQAGSAPCSGGQTCNETTDICEGGGSCPDCIDWTSTTTVSYSSQDISANVTVESADSILLEDNTWRRTTQTFNVTANTVIEFDFQSTSEGEIHGIGFDEDDTLTNNTRIFQLHGTQNWGSAFHDFDNYSGTSVTSYTIPVGQFYTGSAMYLVLVNDNDAGSGNTSRFQNVRIYEDVPVGCTTDEDFETSGGAGWTTSGTCSTGTFILGTPTQQTSTVITQPAGDHTTGSGNAIYTASNTSAGVNDVDGGECVVTSPVFNVTDASDLSIWYFHGQRDATGDPSGDYFVLEASINGGAYSPFVSFGDTQNVAAWTNANTTVPAGASVQLRVRVSDGTASGDIVEGGIDDLTICPAP